MCRSSLTRRKWDHRSPHERQRKSGPTLLNCIGDSREDLYGQIAKDLNDSLQRDLQVRLLISSMAGGSG